MPLASQLKPGDQVEFSQGYYHWGDMMAYEKGEFRGKACSPLDCWIRGLDGKEHLIPIATLRVKI